ncbi:MAG: tRNA (guanosine(37)-N1)-methyltransferase TrmD [Chloroflexi bacterium]|nr:tRNA (guanosine(37)-N1)-methyltransferase TrmD [Chloroflexota bacterium]
MRIHVLTLFPEMLEGPLQTSVIGRAIRNGVLEVSIHQLRDFATDRHAVVDDQAYGGGPGMVLKPEPIFAAVESIVSREGERDASTRPRVLLMSPQGRLLTDRLARELARERTIILICGRYEGVDERVIEHLVDDEVSIGDYVLTGGELPALVTIEAVSRFVPGVLGSADSARRDSLSVELEGLLQGPVYTRPAEFRGWRVPDVLLSGDHAAIEKWRREQALKRTKERRPDLIG